MMTKITLSILIFVIVQNIPESGGAGTNSVCKVQPSFWGFDRMRTLAIFHFFDRVIIALFYDGFLIDHCMGNVVY